MHEQRRVAAVVDDLVRAAAVRPEQRFARCTTSTPRASRPSRRRPRCRAASRACRSGPTATAAAAWSWVEKMLHDTQRTSAPRAASVSISTAVCTVMWRLPMMRSAGERLRGGVAPAQLHEPRHLVLGEADLPAAPFGEGEVGDLEGRGGGQRPSVRPPWIRLCGFKDIESGRPVNGAVRARNGSEASCGVEANYPRRGAGSTGNLRHPCRHTDAGPDPTARRRSRSKR